MKKGFYLSTCSTCIRIKKEVSFPSDIEWVDIKTNPIGESDLEELYQKTGSYEAIFSKRSLKYAEIKEFVVNEESYRAWLLKEYTFLKRPVVIYDDFVSVGNDKQVIEALKIRFGAA
ncbi:MAG: arsenate reductase family protein [Bacteroidota bacterium]